MLRLAILFCTIFSFAIAKPLNVRVESEIALLMNAETGEVIFEKSGRIEKNPASTTKVATALFSIIKHEDDISKIFTASPDCLTTVPHKVKEANSYSLPAYWLEPDGTHFSVKSGEQLSFKDLLYGMMINSGNDAANVIAKNSSKDIPTFMREMNAYLRSIGCKQTYFTNPHGLYQPEHYSTAYDIALITKEAIKNSIFRGVFSAINYDRPKTNKQNTKSVKNNNKLLSNSKFYYPNVIGSKTGYTSRAKFNLVSAAEGNGRRLIAVILNGDKEARYRDTIALYDAAFTEKKETRLLFKWEENQFTLPMEKTNRDLTATLMDDMTLAYYPSEEPDISTKISWNEISLPIKEGQVVGEVIVLDSSTKQPMLSKPIYATKPVEYSKKHKSITWISSHWYLWVFLLAFPFIFRRKRSS